VAARASKINTITVFLVNRKRGSGDSEAKRVDDELSKPDLCIER